MDMGWWALASTGTAIVLASFLLSACSTTPASQKLELRPAAFSDLPGWNADHVCEALPALLRSCKPLMQKPEWQAPCNALAQLAPNDETSARAFFEKYFQAYATRGSDGDTGLFTGYYEAELHGSLTAGGKYQTPLYARPGDLISVDLGAFKSELKGQHIEGKVVGDKLQPYDDRAQIEEHTLKNRAQVLLWVDDPIDAFFLAIQGSGRVTLDNGTFLNVGCDTPNGHSYVAIGKPMAEAGDISKPVTMQKIRAWLSEHPDRAQNVMNLNPSYVFFRIIKDDAPIGAEGVALTPGRSMAVDPSLLTLGIPIWLDTTDGKGASLQRLMIAQDTGGAIKGPIRGDIFWGYGVDAEAQAGAMQSSGKYYLLLPKAQDNQMTSIPK